MSAFFEDDDNNQQPMFADDDQATDDQGDEGGEEEGGGESGNRLFMFGAIGLGVLVLVAILCGGGWLFMNNSRTASGDLSPATQQAADATVAAGVALTQQVLQATPTDLPTETATIEPSATPLMVVESTDETAPTTPDSVAETATIAALNTQMASVSLGTPLATTASGGTDGNKPTLAAAATKSGSGGATLPAAATSLNEGKTAAAKTGTPRLSNTGFADEVGLPSLFVAALVMVAVIFLARRLRNSPMAR